MSILHWKSRYWFGIVTLKHVCRINIKISNPELKGGIAAQPKQSLGVEYRLGKFGLVGNNIDNGREGRDSGGWDLGSGAGSTRHQGTEMIISALKHGGVDAVGGYDGAGDSVGGNGASGGGGFGVNSGGAIGDGGVDAVGGYDGAGDSVGGNGASGGGGFGVNSGGAIGGSNEMVVTSVDSHHKLFG
ncbi:glycine-rich cell wall structural protein 1.0-like [Olea europaea var. sylvestris]|uniref:glycine-rich cell wall structural protein 1.0-like n=1 Tax=Olea europaea var. sylvestris TaxID=158386 RepID=UPI000C1CFA1E|nr:glycine-rich cell wall structural protein 1.0-like [Olea europaea var. sylvestris]